MYVCLYQQQQQCQFDNVMSRKPLASRFCIIYMYICNKYFTPRHASIL